MLEEITGSLTAGQVSHKLKTNRICLLDADFIKYVIISRVGKRLKSNVGLTASHEERRAKFLKEEYDSWMQENIYEKIADPVIFVFSGKSYNTFRHKVAYDKKYKGDRKPSTEYENCGEDMHLIMKRCLDEQLSLLFEDLEADDVVAMLQDDDYTYIASQDKDSRQSFGWHYDFAKNAIFQIDPKVAVYNLAYQLIVGDAGDKIPGIKGYGDDKAVKFLEKLRPGQFIPEILNLYHKLYGQIEGTDRFTETWNLVKTRLPRGEFFISEHQRMFTLKNMLVEQIQKGLL